MSLSMGKWLFPHAAPEIRRRRMELVYVIGALLLLVCGAVVMGVWWVNRASF